MQTSNNLEFQKNQIFDLLEQKGEITLWNNDGYYRRQIKSTIKDLDNKIYDIITTSPIGSLDCEFIEKLNSSFFKVIKSTWYLKSYKIWDAYLCTVSCIEANSQNRFQELENLSLTLSKIVKEKNLDGISFDKNIIKQVYLSGSKEILEVYKKYFPVPPITLFELDNQPLTIAENECKKMKSVTNFISLNVNDSNLEKKIMLIQRHVRSQIRKRSEVERISKLYFEGDKDKAIKSIINANTPYRPRKCSPELAARIMNAAQQVELFSTVKHFCSTNNLSMILDNCLYGRKNLIDSYTDFRVASLHSCDIRDGDFNVICFGPGAIDTSCIKERTVGLIFDFGAIVDTTNYNKNPSMFFKQMDFGYNPDRIKYITLGDIDLSFCHTRQLRCGDSKSINLQFYNTYWGLQYYSEIPKYNFISYNVSSMQQILTLNFFRFLDSLLDVNSLLATSKTNEIYDEISNLNDKELVEFLTDLGRKMSFTSEFNFSGAYKIDLNALKEIEIYEGDVKINSVRINTLINELNSGCYETINKLAEIAPEIFKSKRFTEHLSAELNDKSMLQKFL